ncbi:MAG TPA: lytic transglycosylase domain-containing protein [Acidobacteriaceae bacterium]|nr:lytic transglycosylase domain-containing protein [Acidobacteriaceae bacterium]
MKRLKTFLLASAAIFAAGCLLPAHAADRVYLRTGADLVCDHQQNLNGQVRLFLTSSEDNYLDVAAEDILRQEPVAMVPVVSISDSPQIKPQAASIVAAPIDLPGLLHQAGAKHNLDPDLLASVVHAESGGHIRAISPVGAQGLMQLMPGTAADLGVRNSFAPEQNVAGGTTYLDALLMYYHENLALALAAYNAGPAAVARYHGIPPYPATRRYVASVIHDYNQRKLREARRQRTLHPAASAIASVVAHP